MPDDTTPSEQEIVRVCAIADLHGYLPVLAEPCDLLLIAGDICPVTDHSFFRQVDFLCGPFRKWLDDVPAKRVAGIAGNHDFVFQYPPAFKPGSFRWDYLRDGEVTIDGLKIYGSPWQPVFHNWAFNLPEHELERKWAKIPDDTDILLLHGPPVGYGDMTIDGRSTGSPSLLPRIEAVKPQLTVYGHIHEGRGRWETEWGTMANVTLRDERYRVVHEPMYFNVEVPAKVGV